MRGEKDIYRYDKNNDAFIQLTPKDAGELKIKEKAIEEWIVGDPRIIFSDPSAVMIIAQEVTGEPFTDVLAIDSQGNLIIIEIKRSWSDRGTIGQILDYASHLSEWSYDDFNDRWRKFRGEEAKDLLEEFKGFVENPDFRIDDFLKGRRLFILASDRDESMKRIINWLQQYQVPVDFVPFRLYQEGDQLYLQIEKIYIEPLPPKEGWHGDWFFNTNETHNQGAYERMFEQSAIAVWGYGGGKDKEMLDMPDSGQRVFAYVNGRGIAAVGRFTDEEAFPSNDIFSQIEEDEFHRKVQWESVVDVEKAVKPSESSQKGYNLPVRSTLCKMYNKNVADWISKELAQRKQGK